MWKTMSNRQQLGTIKISKLHTLLFMSIPLHIINSHQLWCCFTSHQLSIFHSKDTVHEHSVSTYSSYMHHLTEKKANTVSMLYSFCKTRCLMLPENIQSLGLLKLIHNDFNFEALHNVSINVKLTNDIDFKKWFPAHSLLQFICPRSHCQTWHRQLWWNVTCKKCNPFCLCSV